MHTSRGRLAVHVVDSYDELGSGATGQDWLPAQAEPATANLLLGLTRGAGERTLVLANPGADEVRATVTVVTPTSTFAPTGVEPVRVAPDSTEAVSLDDVLAQAAKDGAIGLLVESNGPVTASLRQFAGADLVPAHRRARRRRDQPRWSSPPGRSTCCSPAPTRPAARP